MSLALVSVRGRRVGAITEVTMLLDNRVERTTLPIEPEAPVRRIFMSVGADDCNDNRLFSRGSRIDVLCRMLVGRESIDRFEVSDKADTNVR